MKKTNPNVFRKKVKKPAWWIGHIYEIEKDKIYCILTKHKRLDKELWFDRNNLTEEQNKIVTDQHNYNVQNKEIHITNCIRFDVINFKIQFMTSDGKGWC